MQDQTDGVAVSAGPDGRVELNVDLSIYSIDAVLGCGYVFVDRCYVFLDKPAPDQVRVSLSPKAGRPPAELSALAGEFQNQLLTQTLRQHVGQQHEKIRELIIARALFGAAPEIEAPAPAASAGVDRVDAVDRELAASPDVPREEDDFFDDPLGIGVPWEQRFKDKAGAAPAAAPEAPAPAAADDAKGPKGSGGEPA
jgi:His-Xaa-Ser system protein HxsD